MRTGYKRGDKGWREEQLGNLTELLMSYKQSGPSTNCKFDLCLTPDGGRSIGVSER